MFPIIKDYLFPGNDGKDYFVEIEIFELLNSKIFPEGVSAIFRLFEIDHLGQRKLIYLIDNHAPYGFHEHDKLPDDHESRVTIHANSWKDVWRTFQIRCQELTK